MASIFLTYIRLLSKVQIFKLKLLNKNFKIIGISGSAGKTSTMMAVYAILKDYYRCKYSYKANSETGIPLDILGLHPQTFTKQEWIKIAILAPLKLLINWKIYDIYIVEMGVDAIREPKNMKYLLKILTPDIAIYLNVNATHFQNYETNNSHFTKEQIIDKIAKDKGLLIKSLPKNGLAVLNGDDERVYRSRKLAKCPTQIISLKDIKEEIEIPGFILPVHYQYTFNIAIAAAEYFHISKEKAVANLKKNFKLEPGRSSIFKGVYGTTILDSSYNSSKEPLIDMIDLLNKLAKQGSSSIRIGVLGDMRELGGASKEEHEEVARYAFDKIDMFFLVGQDMKRYFIPELLKLGVQDKDIKWFEKTSICAEYILDKLKSLKENKYLLVKGSQNKILLEIVVEKLLADKNDARNLCRRGKYWDNIRKNY